MESNSSPLKSAAEEIKAQTEIPGTEPTNPGAPKPKGKPGPKPGSKRKPGPKVGAGPGASQSRIESAVAATAEPTKREDIEPIIGGILSLLSRVTETRGPDPEEIREGAKAAVPAWDRYLTVGMAKAGPWAPLILFFTIYAAPRAIEKWEQAKTLRAAQKALGGPLERESDPMPPQATGDSQPSGTPLPFRQGADGSISRA